MVIGNVLCDVYEHDVWLQWLVQQARGRGTPEVESFGKESWRASCM